VPDADLSVRHKEVSMTNMTSLPLTATLQINYPFQVSLDVATVVTAETAVSSTSRQCCLVSD